jgi:hypothetical protein
MTLSRWKLMAGVLGLSMCGLAALAEPACRTVGYTRRGDDPKPAPEPEKPVEAAKPLPLPVSPPPVTEVPPPTIPLTDDKKPAPFPPTPTPVDSKAETKLIPLPPVNSSTTPPAVDLKLLKEVADVQNPPVPLPTLKDEPAKKDTAPLPVRTETTYREPLPAVVKSELPPTPAPLPSPPPTTVTPAPFTPPPAPAPSLPALEPQPQPLTTPRVTETIPPPAVQVKAEERPVTTVGKKLKVTLHLSDDKPWFEVKDGDDLVLKVTAEGVNLAAASDAKKAGGVLTAAGGVTFRTLGGYGTCDELRVVPGTGEVEVTGKVAVTSNWGKSETTATADKMTFRLGEGKK